MPKFLKLVLFYTCIQLVGVASLLVVVAVLSNLIARYQEVAVTAGVVLFFGGVVVTISIGKAQARMAREKNNVRK